MFKTYFSLQNPFYLKANVQKVKMVPHIIKFRLANEIFFLLSIFNAGFVFVFGHYI